MALIGVYEISKILTAPRRLEVTLANVVNVLSSMLQMRHGMICILDSEGDPTWWPPPAGRRRWRARSARMCPRRPSTRSSPRRCALVVQDVTADPLFAGHEDLFGPPEEATVSFIGVPIKADHHVMGTLSIDRIWDGTARFRFDEDVRFLTMVANLVGQTVRLHKLVASDRDRLIARRTASKGAAEEKSGAERRWPRPPTDPPWASWAIARW